MMRAARLALIALLAWGSIACAQFWIGQVKGYTGPGDVIPGATAFWGLRCDSTTNQAYLGQRNDGGEAFAGNLAEVGIWPIAFSTAQITAMCHNQFAYWGTSVSC